MLFETEGASYGDCMQGAVRRSSSRSLFMAVVAAAGIVGILSLGPFLFPLLALAATNLLDAVVLLDRRLLALLNGLSRQSRGFDLFMYGLSVNTLLQGGVFGALFFGAWAATGDAGVDRQKRETLLSSLVGLYAAVFLALAVRAALPFRARPVVDPALSFLTPYLPSGFTLAPTSTSFPSGHATVFFAFPVALLAVSRMLGLFAFVYALVGISVPRMYFGLHYPTDILAGAVLSIAAVVVVSKVLRGRSLTSSLLAWSEKHPAASNGLLFFCCLELATEFSTVRAMLPLIANGYLTRLVGP